MAAHSFYSRQWLDIGCSFSPNRNFTEKAEEKSQKTRLRTITNTWQSINDEEKKLKWMGQYGYQKVFDVASTTSNLHDDLPSFSGTLKTCWRPLPTILRPLGSTNDRLSYISVIDDINLIKPVLTVMIIIKMGEDWVILKIFFVVTWPKLLTVGR